MVDIEDEDGWGAAAVALFQDPPGYLKEPEVLPEVQVTRKNGEVVTLSQSKHHSLWGHMVWNASRVLAEYLDEHRELCENQRVLEFGAGCGLPSIAAALNGSSVVISTEYPDAPLLATLTQNLQRAISQASNPNLNIRLYGPQDDDEVVEARLLLGDLVFNHFAHSDLLRSCAQCLAPAGGVALVAFSHHRVNKAQDDLKFFQLAEREPFCLQVTKIKEVVFPKPMFERDPGDPKVRATVHLYTLKHSQQPPQPSSLPPAEQQQQQNV